MKVYFTGTDLAFIHRVREIIAFKGVADKVTIIPSKYVDDNVLLGYDEESKKLIEIKSIKEHSF